MSTQRKRNDAYAGDHVTPDGRRGFHIFYIDKAGAATIRAAQKRPWPRGHPGYVKTGWFWISQTSRKNAKGNSYGNFTSSRGAYQDAVMHLQESGRE